MTFCLLKLGFRSLGLLCVLGASVSCSSLDREAFTFTNYELTAQLDPEQHRLGVRGKITLRNDSSTPQKIAVLQISSSLDWRSVRAGDKALQFVRQPYTSDIDHTGGLSEALVTLPQQVAPKGTVDLDIAYEGVILLDAARLMRIGTPEDVANNSDWDRIDASFTGVRGVGYVAWYPIATEAADLSQGYELSETLGRWKAREAESRMSLMFASTQKSKILFSGHADGFVVTPDEGMVKLGAFSINRLGTNVPTFALAGYKTIAVKGLSTINFLPGKEAAAESYADALGSLDPLPQARGPKELQVAELPDAGAAPFVCQGLLLTPLKTVRGENRLTLVYALARQEAASPHPWIQEGLAHFAQVLDIEHQRGRKAALDYLDAHRSLLVETEKQVTSTDAGGPADERSLINTTDEIYLQSKAMWVWWMLREMVGDAELNVGLSNYSASEDKAPSYLQALLERPAERDLGRFFDDWVYHDRGLPNLKIESAFSSKARENAFLVTVTVANLGQAGAEVPLTVKFAGGEVTQRLEVRAKSKGVIRVETPSAAQQIVVNDGSVPESDVTNNVFKLEAAEK
jgi:hypothetical protein